MIILKKQKIIKLAINKSSLIMQRNDIKYLEAEKL